MSPFAATLLIALVPPIAVEGEFRRSDAGAGVSLVAVDVNAIAATRVVQFGSVELGEFPVELTGVRSNGRTWASSWQDAPDRAIVLSEVNGQIAAGIWATGRVFSLTPTGASDNAGRALCELRELAADEVVQCNGATLSPGQDPPAASITPRGPVECPCQDDAQTIDVLVLYTPAARIAAGGAAALQARVQNGLDAATLAISSSGVAPTTMNMAGFVEIAYDEAAPTWGDHLVRLTSPNDGILDAAHTLRDQYNADLVSLCIDDTRFFGGQAFYATFWPQSAFSVLNWRAMGGGSLTLAHELGHNFGCAHNREHADNGVFYFGFGHHFVAGGTERGTIMSYVGAGIPYYSNPHLTYLGTPMGAGFDDALPTDNALVIARSRYALANFRDAPRITDCNANGIDDDADIAGGASLDVNSDCRPDECERRVYVDVSAASAGDGSSWTLARRDLDAVLYEIRTACSDVTEVWVADGLYRPDGAPGDRYARFSLRSGLRLYGGFQGQSRAGGGETSLAQRDPAAHPTILSGDIGEVGIATDNAISVVEANNVTAALLDGFVIEDGYSDFGAAGLWCFGSEIAVRNCVFRFNVATYDGAGLYVENGSAEVNSCQFLANDAGGSGGAIACNYSGFVRVRDCLFDANLAGYGGGAINLYQTGGDVVGSQFTNNYAQWGGGIGASGAALRMDGCVVADNHAINGGSGAVDIYGSNVTIANCILRDNTASFDGGAIYMQNSTLAVHGSTIVGNTSALRGGGIAYWNSPLTASNCILWANVDSTANVQDRQILRYSGSAALSSNIVGGWSGTLGGAGNSGADPLFVNLATRDLALAAGSPAIDSGNNTLIPADALDRDGDGNLAEAQPSDALGRSRCVDDPAAANVGTPDPARPALALVDRGAIERQVAPCPGDVNGDRAVNLTDLATLLAHFGTASGATLAHGDLDGDGDVDLTDLATLLSHFGSACP